MDALVHSKQAIMFKAAREQPITLIVITPLGSIG